jgi:hypothetical protein
MLVLRLFLLQLSTSSSNERHETPSPACASSVTLPTASTEAKWILFWLEQKRLGELTSFFSFSLLARVEAEVLSSVSSNQRSHPLGRLRQVS